VGPVTPLPVRLITRVEFVVELDETVTIAEKEATDWGLKVMVVVQLPPGTIGGAGSPHGLLPPFGSRVNSESPERSASVMSKSAVPVLETVNTWLAELPTMTFP